MLSELYVDPNRRNYTKRTVIDQYAMIEMIDQRE